MYGVQNIDCQVLLARPTMRLRGKKFDASMFIVTGKAFSDFVVLLSVGAIQQSRRGVQDQGSMKHQGNLLRGKCGALTIRPSGPANTTLRFVSTVH